MGKCKQYNARLCTLQYNAEHHLIGFSAWSDWWCHYFTMTVIFLLCLYFSFQFTLALNDSTIHFILRILGFISRMNLIAVPGLSVVYNTLKTNLFAGVQPSLSRKSLNTRNYFKNPKCKTQLYYQKLSCDFKNQYLSHLCLWKRFCFKPILLPTNVPKCYAKWCHNSNSRWNLL